LIAIKSLAALAAVVSAAWVFKDPGFESALSFIVSISALISAFVVERRRRKRPSQHQVVSGGSAGIQAGGDVLLGNVGSKENVQ
jgi:hypothetical protein